SLKGMLEEQLKFRIGSDWMGNGNWDDGNWDWDGFSLALRELESSFTACHKNESRGTLPSQ
ncbi:hypothetical protein Q2337_27100, partial [Escherichia coli]|nr:hypothetical protein [Escherichia coli]